jgi:hypothetical protein
MKKKEITENNILQPAEVKTTGAHADLRNNPATTFEPLPGDYHLKEVNGFGQEIEGTDISVTPRMYERVYKDMPNFIVKKNLK